MRRFLTLSLTIAAAVAVPVAASADTVLTRNGTAYVGRVERTPTGYAIQTESGRVDVAAADVRRVMYDGGHATADAAAADATSRPVGRSKLDAATTAKMADAGQQSLAAGDWAGARSIFASLLKADASDPVAARGLGYAALRQNDLPTAAAALDLAVHHARGHPDRSLVLALSAAFVGTRQPMRAVKLAGDYVRDHPTDAATDEPLLDALGTALSRVPGPAVNGSAYADAARAHDRAVAELEGTHPGKKRWGATWVDPGTADAAAARVADAAAKVAAAQKAADDANAAYKAKYAIAYGDATHLPMLLTDRERQEIAKAAFDSLPGLLQAKKDAYANVVRAQADLAAVPKPPYPDAVNTDDLDLTVVPKEAATH